MIGWLIIFASTVFSVGGILICMHSGQTSDAGRGGAIAVAISLFALFNRETLSLQLSKRILHGSQRRERIREIGKSRPPADIAEVDRRLTILASAIEDIISASDKSQKTQSLCLGFSTFIGTMAWGFGDWFAVWLLRVPGIGHLLGK